VEKETLLWLLFIYFYKTKGTSKVGHFESTVQLIYVGAGTLFPFPPMLCMAVYYKQGFYLHKA